MGQAVGRTDGEESLRLRWLADCRAWGRQPRASPHFRYSCSDIEVMRWKRGGGLDFFFGEPLNMQGRPLESCDPHLMGS